MRHGLSSRCFGVLLRLHSLHSRRWCKVLALLQVLSSPRSPAPELLPTHSHTLEFSLPRSRVRARGVFLAPALSVCLSLHFSSTLTLSTTLSLTQPCHDPSSQPTCRGEGTCAPDVINGGTGAGGGHCLCNRHHFAKDCSVKLKPKWSLEYAVSDVTVSHMVRCTHAKSNDDSYPARFPFLDSLSASMWI